MNISFYRNHSVLMKEDEECMYEETKSCDTINNFGGLCV